MEHKQKNAMFVYLLDIFQILNPSLDVVDLHGEPLLRHTENMGSELSAEYDQNFTKSNHTFVLYFLAVVLIYSLEYRSRCKKFDKCHKCELGKYLMSYT